ncbi:MAG: amidohydrolase family protein [Rhodospirillaceae bacterium]|nr:amidohydrolase family protein [Rhodospirillaceae bacterium]
MTDTTVIRNIAWLVAWDGTSHVYLRDADLAFENGAVTFVGKGYQGPVTTEGDGRNRMVMPGLIDIHTHAQSETLRKGITDETHSPGFWHSSLYEHLPVFEPTDVEGNAACLSVSLGELLLSGVTTMVDLSGPFDGWLDALAGSGIRAVAAPFFRDARWFTRDGHKLDYDWNLEGGRKGFEKAQRVIDLAQQHPSGRLSGMVSPSQVDTCSEELLRDPHAYATERNLPWTIHAAQSVTEFLEMQRRHGKTPMEWLADIGVLDERSIIAHCIFFDHHPWLHWTSHKDLDRMRDSGATVAHCPTVFTRRGITLRTLGGYIRHGINVGLGTDTYPHNMLDEMRTAAVAARVIGESVADLTYAEVFHAATIAGAKALRRDDLGRLSVGARADFVCVDLKHPAMMPVREPMRSLLVVAGERAVRDVYVDGDRVVADGKLLTMDLQAELERLEEAQKRMMKTVPQRDWNGRTVDQMAPMMLETVESVN